MSWDPPAGVPESAELLGYLLEGNRLHDQWWLECVDPCGVGGGPFCERTQYPTESSPFRLELTGPSSRPVALSGSIREQDRVNCPPVGELALYEEFAVEGSVELGVRAKYQTPSGILLSDPAPSSISVSAGDCPCE